MSSRQNNIVMDQDTSAMRFSTIINSCKIRIPRASSLISTNNSGLSKYFLKILVDSTVKESIQVLCHVKRSYFKNNCCPNDQRNEFHHSSNWIIKIYCTVMETWVTIFVINVDYEENYNTIKVSINLFIDVAVLSEILPMRVSGHRILISI